MAERHALKIGSWNIAACRGMDGKVDPERTARALRDLGCFAVAVQELPTPKTSRFERALRGVGLKLTYSPSPAGEEGFGIGVVSRIDPVSSRTIDLGQGRCVVICTFPHVVVASAHLDHKSGTRRGSQARAISSALASAEGLVVLGIDANDLPNSDAVCSFDEGGSMHVIPKLGGESGATVKADSPTREVDFIVCNRPISGSVVEVIPDPLTSDHRPITCAIST